MPKLVCVVSSVKSCFLYFTERFHVWFLGGGWGGWSCFNNEQKEERNYVRHMEPSLDSRKIRIRDNAREHLGEGLEELFFSFRQFDFVDGEALRRWFGWAKVGTLADRRLT